MNWDRHVLHNGVNVPPKPPLIRIGGVEYKPHPWNERKDAVLETFQQRILALVEPFGFAPPYKPDDALNRVKELHWLANTQNEELAPEWLRLSANGIPAQSKDADEEHGDGDDESYNFEIAEAARLAEFDYQIEKNRIEPFLRTEDERQWYSELPKRYWWAYDKDGNIGLIPGNQRTTVADCHKQLQLHIERGDIPSLDEVVAMSTARRQPRTVHQRPELTPIDAWLNGLDPERDEFRVYDEQHRYDKGRAKYAPSDPCPDIATGRCVDGVTLEHIETYFKFGRTQFTEHYGPCTSCLGSGVIPHTLGLHDTDSSV